MSIPSAGWMLQHIPIVSYFAADNTLNSLQVVGGCRETIFGHARKSLIGKNHFLNEQFLAPEDRAVLREHREAVWREASPVISRLDVIDQVRGPVPCLVAAHALYDGSQRIGLSGVAIELTGIPELQGAKGVLSKGAQSRNWNQRTSLPAEFTHEWLVGVLPVAFVVSENDPDYTIRHLSGSMERVVGYTSGEILSGKPKSWSLIDPGEIDLADEKLERAIADGRSVILRVPLAHRSGGQVPILAIVAPYRPAGHPNGFFVSAVLAIQDAKALQGPTETFVMAEHRDPR